MSEAAQRKEKQKCAIEKPRPDNARRLRGIYFIDPADAKFKKLVLKNALRKVEVPMPAAMPCKTPVNCCGETCRSIEKHKTKYACGVEADESMRIRLEGVPYWYHQRKRNKITRPLQFGTQFSDASSITNTGCNGGSGENIFRHGS